MDPLTGEALGRLRDGNERHATRTHPAEVSTAGFGPLEETRREPLAAVIACSDPGVSPEAVFDQPPEALFVVRAGAQVLDDATTGSLEYAVAELKVPLIVVLGHEECRVVATALKEASPAGSLGVMLDALEEPVLRARHAGWPLHMLLAQAVRENVSGVVNDLRTSHIIRPHVDEGKLQIVGAVYRERSGRVEWLEAPAR